MFDKSKAERVYHEEVNEKKILKDDEKYINKVAKEHSDESHGLKLGKVKIDKEMRSHIEEDDKVQKHLRDHGETNTYSDTFVNK